MIPAKVHRHKHLHLLKEIVMIFLAIFSVFLLILEVYIGLNLATVPWVGTLDLILCIIFIADFALHYHLSPHKHTFFQTHWFELLAAFPFVSPFTYPLLSVQIFFGYSLLHVLRLIRLAIRMRILLELSLEYTRHSYLIYIFTSVCVVIFSGAAGFYHFEFGINPNVKNYWDAVWWAIVSSTTIGYGDIYPITPGGRIVAIVVMLFGITALGAFIATLNSVFINPRFKRIQKRI